LESSRSLRGPSVTALRLVALLASQGLVTRSQELVNSSPEPAHGRSDLLRTAVGTGRAHIARTMVDRFGRQVSGLGCSRAAVISVLVVILSAPEPSAGLCLAFRLSFSGLVTNRQFGKVVHPSGRPDALRDLLLSTHCLFMQASWDGSRLTQRPCWSHCISAAASCPWIFPCLVPRWSRRTGAAAAL
jgi:hypothetical protein